MCIYRIDAPGQTILRLVVSLVRNGELNPVEGLHEGLHHGENDFLVIVIRDAGEVEIGGESSLGSEKHFPETRASLEGQSLENAALQQ